MIRYPNGAPYEPDNKSKKTKTSHKSKEEISLSAANRGMNLEEDINISNEYYRENDIALIYKRPTPINIVKVDYTHGAKITNAYFEEQSTTDYNGVYRGKYIDFEAKNTKSKTSFPLGNISEHQITHLKRVNLHGGIAFFIIQFQTLDQVFLLDAKYVIDCYEHGTRKSIPLKLIKENGLEIRKGYNPRLYYLEAVDKLYF